MKIFEGINWDLKQVNNNAVAHGFNGSTVAEDLANIHGEVSEAWDDYRNGHEVTETWSDETGKPCGVPSEIADVILRCMVFCGKHNIDLEAALTSKHEHNLTRPFKHGGKRN